MHPLLDILLPKLPRVEHVEYTHGEREKGADFVIDRTDDTFTEAEYIGIIAKAKKISQDYTDVERQIKECELPRTVFGGKKQIYLTEIWVISTSTISPNAQDKIQHEYNTRKIKFIPGVRLAELIDKYMQSYWAEIPLQVGEYLSRTWQSNSELDKQLSLLQVKDKNLYVEQDVFPVVEKKYKRKYKETKPVTVRHVVENHKIILMEGEMGSGKSKLLRNAISYYSNPLTYLKEKILPIAISYKEFSQKYQGDAEKLIDATIDSKTRSELPVENQFLILIDGVDEKDLELKALTSELSSTLEGMSKLPNVKAIVTSRYLGEYEESQKLLPYANRFELRPLSTRRLIEFIKLICESFSLKSRIVEDLKKSALFKELPHSPIAAILLARLMQENTEDLPSNMTELYLKYTELLLGRWDIDKGLQSQKEYEALDKILTQISTYIIENGLSKISQDEAEEIALKYLDKRNLGIDNKDLFQKDASQMRTTLRR